MSVQHGMMLGIAHHAYDGAYGGACVWGVKYHRTVAKLRAGATFNLPNVKFVFCYSSKTPSLLIYPEVCSLIPSQYHLLS